MARRLGELLRKEAVPLDEAEIKQFINRQLSREFDGGAICRRLSQGWAEIEVSSPTFHQEILLYAFDLTKITRQQTGYQIKQIKIRQSY